MKISIIGLSLLALLTACSGVIPEPPNPVVPPSNPVVPPTTNTSLEAATPLTIGTTIDGVIAGGPQIRHFYTVFASEKEKLQITAQSKTVFANSVLDPHVTIYAPDKDGRAATELVVEKDDDSGKDHESEILLNPEKTGLYTIVVTSFKIYEAKSLLDEENSKKVVDNSPLNLYRLKVVNRNGAP